ncbi:hypothetical protein LTS10_008047 [Elasticomyces elasticus]|nr:hypothetical protein LTS10_008047 [Elasticomyces elasticus]
MDENQRAINVNIGDLTTLGPDNTINAGVFFNNGEEQATKLERCRNTLFLTDPEISRADLISAKGQRVEGTCEWVWENPVYRSWRFGDARLLWINGGPGKGKTVLSIYLTQELEKEGHAIYFFCENGEQDRNSATAVLRGLIWHVTKRCPQLTEHLLEPLSNEQRAHAALASRETLWNMLVKLLQDPRIGTAFCVLDGVDECDEESQSWLVSKLVALDAAMPSDTRRRAAFTADIKIAIVSRPLSGLSRSSQVRLDPDNEEQVGKDITRFVAARVQELAERVQLQGAALREIESTLLERSEGTFLWIGFAMLELLKKETTTEILKALHTLPQGLDSMYCRMLAQIDDSHKATCSSILQWVTLAVRPLTLLELAAATGTNATEYATQRQAIRDEVMACGALVRVGVETVGLVHQSARDYLLKCEVNITRGHYDLAVFCVERLDQLFYFSIEAQKPLDDYSLRFWPNHARASGALGEGLLTRSQIFKYYAAYRLDYWLKNNYDMDGHILHMYHTPVPSIHIASYLGILPWVQALVKQSKIPRFHSGSKTFHRLVNSRDERERSPLWWAEFGGNKDTAQWLSANGARLEVGGKAQQSVTAERLVAASFNGQEAMVRALLAEGVDADAQARSASDGGNALQAASVQGHQAIVRLLLKKGAVVNAQGGKYGYALHAASYSGHEAIVRLLLDHGADVNAQGGKHGYALHAASYSGYEAIVRLLLDDGADVNAQNVDFGSALQAVSVNGNEAIVRLLLAAGSDVNAQGGYYGDALQGVSASGDEEIVRLLLAAGADVNARGGQFGDALQAASANGYKGTVRLLLAAGADVDAQGGDYKNALQAACYWRHEAVVRLLLKYGAAEQWSSDREGKKARNRYNDMFENCNTGSPVNGTAGTKGQVKKMKTKTKTKTEQETDTRVRVKSKMETEMLLRSPSSKWYRHFVRNLKPGKSA